MTDHGVDWSSCVFIAAAGGRGLRAGGETPKQYRRIAGRSLFEHTLLAIGKAAPGVAVQPVIHPGDAELFQQVAARVPDTIQLLPCCSGGGSRQQSVHAGLEVISEMGFKNVFIHDVARPFLSYTLTRSLMKALDAGSAAAPVLPVTDSLRLQLNGSSQAISRDGLHTVQTPQAFRLDVILNAHRRAREAGRDDFSDDASLAEWAGESVTLVPGDPLNTKITTPGDFQMAEMRMMSQLADIRTGSGYDVHAFCPGDHVWLGGVRIPHTHGLEGHSDADAALHALTDALLGAIAAGDIGVHFPPSDARWKGAASHNFVREAVRLIHQRGGMIAHIDLTIICEAPRMGPHRDAIRAAISDMTGVEPDRISLKATTSEQLGFTGRREGLAAHAIATVRLPLPGGESA